MTAPVASFRRTRDAFGFFSNMAPSPIIIDGVTYRTLEALFQCAKHPDRPDVQQAIIEKRSPMEAKKAAYLAKCRGDWNDIRIEVMRWCLKMKLLHNHDAFMKEFELSGDMEIIEDSNFDKFWAAKKGEDGIWHGENHLGKLLMELRSELRESEKDVLEVVYSPDVTNFKLFGKHIGTQIKKS